MKLSILVISLLTALNVSVDAAACGDSLYRVGKGVAYRTYSAPLPGNLLVFGTSKGAKELAQQLARSGHGVHMVDSAEALTAELKKGGYDVVIAPYSEHDTVENTAVASNASFLPVAMSQDEERIARKSYDRVMVPEKHELKHYLKEIHRALKSQS